MEQYLTFFLPCSHYLLESLLQNNSFFVYGTKRGKKHYIILKPEIAKDNTEIIYPKATISTSATVTL